MTVTFEPKGEVAEWRLVYDHLVGLKVGDIITYDRLSGILGREFLHGRGPFHRANRELLATHRLGLVNVKGVGYRVVTAAEHEDAARGQHRSARRRLRRAKEWIEHTDRADLTPEVRSRFDQLEEHLSRQIDFTRRLDGRLKKAEQAIAEVREQQADSAGDVEAVGAKVDRLMEALTRRGIDLDTDAA
ncbi:MAG TPA: hypothetical protein VHK88_20120 [Aquihabitans sp.]|jgi:hypothetical protein|nr:hypothetical protein [Aquihabitans sp.]